MEPDDRTNAEPDDTAGHRAATDAAPALQGEAPTAGDVVAEVIGEEAADELDLVTANLPPLATYNVLASFDDNTSARTVIEHLEAARVEGSHISYLALDRFEEAAPDATEGMMDNDQRVDADTHVARQVGKGAALGAGTGAGLGALAGLGLMLVPGVGTLAGLGMLGAAISGAAGGGQLGLVWGGFRRLAVSAAWEKTFVDVRAGRTVIGVHTDDPAELQRAIAHFGDEELHFFDHEGHPVDGPPATGAPAEEPAAR